MQFGVDTDFFFRPTEHRCASEQQFINVDGSHFILASPGKTQKLFGQIRRASDVVLNGIDMFRMGMGMLEINRHERCPALDAHQQIVEIVGDTAGKGSDCLKFLRLLKHLLQSRSLGDVLVDHELVQIFHGDRPEMDLFARSILAGHRINTRPGLPDSRLPPVPKPGFHHRPAIGPIRKSFSEPFLSCGSVVDRVAEHLLEPRVDILVTAVLSDQRNS